MVEPKVHPHTHNITLIVYFAGHRAGVARMIASHSGAVTPKLLMQVPNLHHLPARARNLIAGAEGLADRGRGRGTRHIAQGVAARQFEEMRTVDFACCKTARYME